MKSPQQCHCQISKNTKIDKKKKKIIKSIIYYYYSEIINIKIIIIAYYLGSEVLQCKWWCFHIRKSFEKTNYSFGFWVPRSDNRKGLSKPDKSERKNAENFDGLVYMKLIEWLIACQTTADVSQVWHNVHLFVWFRRIWIWRRKR